MGKTLSEQLVGSGLVTQKQAARARAAPTTGKKLTLAEQLAQRGMVDEQAVERVKLEREAESLNEHPDFAPDHVTHRDLDKAPDLYAFGQVARTLLFDDPSLIGVVISKAHRFKDVTDKTAKAFIWRMYQIRDLLPRCPLPKRERFLFRAFRRHDPKVEIPE